MRSLQTQIGDKLREWPAIKSLGIDIVEHEASDLVAKMNEALATKKGLCIIVSTPSFNCSNPQLPVPVFDGITAAITIFENVLLNRSASGLNVDALSLVVKAAQALWHFKPNGWPTMYLRKNESVTPVSDKKLSGYTMHLTGGHK
ncbi:MAG: hypothetical protein PHP44_11065 [Kiritimatiellae bacterium]|nr:hypothetical protein [Kiritimatiellia bacterium]